jgi:hypothetical protein
MGHLKNNITHISNELKLMFVSTFAFHGLIVNMTACHPARLIPPHITLRVTSLSCPLIPAVCRYDCVFDITDDAGLAASLTNITTVDTVTNVGPCTHALLRLADGNYTLTQARPNTHM